MGAVANFIEEVNWDGKILSFYSLIEYVAHS